MSKARKVAFSTAVDIPGLEERFGWRILPPWAQFQVQANKLKNSVSPEKGFTMKHFLAIWLAGALGP